MEKGWTVIFTGSSSIRAEFVRQALAEAGLEAVILNQLDSSYLTFGEVEVYVREENVEQAKIIVERFEN